jgi:hypothetical protein
MPLHLDENLDKTAGTTGRGRVSSSSHARQLCGRTRVLFARVIADGDMHLKDMALLKIARSGAWQFHG